MFGEHVHFVVAGDHLPRQRGVAADKSVQRLPHHVLSHSREARNVDERFEQRLAIELDGAFADIDGEIGDPLQFRSDLHGRGDEAQIDRRRLHLRDQLDRVLIDVELHLVDGIVIGDDALGHRAVALEQRADGIADGIFDHRAHAQQKLLELFDVSIEVARHPNRPVT